MAHCILASNIGHRLPMLVQFQILFTQPYPPYGAQGSCLVRLKVRVLSPRRLLFPFSPSSLNYWTPVLPSSGERSA